MNDPTPALPGLPPVAGKEISARFDGGRISSDGGVLALRPIETRLGLAERLSACLPDKRDPARIAHSHADMIRARMFAIACGYEDCSDVEALRHDPALKMAAGRLPETGARLMSQPTLSRLENLPCWRALARMGAAMVDLFCAAHARPPEEIVLDIDDATDRTHGGQQLSLFNAHDDCYCFKPIVIFDAATGRPVAALLRPGKRPTGAEAARVLRFVIRRIRQHWPRTRILIRGDSHYAAPEVFDLLEDLGCFYCLGLGMNKALKALAAPWCEDAALSRIESGVAAERRYHETEYRARSWRRARRIVGRIEAGENGADARFIVTNLPGSAETLYAKVYCARGGMENLIKDFKLYAKADRTSCHRWEANQFRLFLHLGAYWLLNELRLAAAKTSFWRRATFETLRREILKIAARVEELRTRIRVAFASGYPYKAALTWLLERIQARAP
jgi:hypothetical protein